MTVALETAETAETTEIAVAPETTGAPTVADAIRSARLGGIDAARGIALLGIMAVHALADTRPDGQPSWDFAIFAGRAAAAFAVLAGVGIAFLSGRKRVGIADARGTVVALAARALVIGAIGLCFGYTDGAIGVMILPYYAVLFLLAIPLVFLPTWLIAVTGVLFAGGAPLLSFVVLPHLPVVTAAHNPGFSFVFHHPLGMLYEMTFTGEYPAVPWVTYICAGLVAGRLNLSRVRVAVGLLVTGTALAVASHATSWYLLDKAGGLPRIWQAQPGSNLTLPETSEMLAFGGDGSVPSSTRWWLAVDAPHTSTPFDLAGTTGTALALLGLMLLVWRTHRVVRWVLGPIAAAGAMTLTIYCLHIWFLNSDYDVYSPNTGYALQVAGVLMFAFAWRMTAGRGPLEGLATSVTRRARRWAGRRT
ncbi:heparan-alpha-glucosaminide N-acetyltransferase domain-containing protein [Amycolatopsis pigmentata]|uniref:Heparan-alpha-glucosaminide N-acetyltransferase domain-containing protein n=1 Tax=Amycolatopsis pigmentata TaxID=450801 RepID=A0ABW5G0N7_9PSEU